MATRFTSRARTMTAEEFLVEYEGVPGRWELVEGIPKLMAGGSIAHARVARNVLVALTPKLRGSGCEPFNSDTGLRLGDWDVRYPDAAIYCDRRDLERDPLTTREFRHPSVIFEVLSPSTARYDREAKLRAYAGVEGLRMVVLLDPGTRGVEVYRPGEAGFDGGPLEAEVDLVSVEPPFVLTRDEMFDLD
jgi:Uma2 family endonuclease